MLSRLDFSNCLLSGSPHYLIGRLQRVQNKAAQACRPGSLESTEERPCNPLLRSLHWLPITAPIQCKLSTLTYTSLFDSGPVCLSNLLHIYMPTRPLLSSKDTQTLTLPSFRTKSFGYRRFSYQSPRHWHSLPLTGQISHSSPSWKCIVLASG